MVKQVLNDLFLKSFQRGCLKKSHPGCWRCGLQARCAFSRQCAHCRHASWYGGGIFEREMPSVSPCGNLQLQERQESSFVCVYARWEARSLSLLMLSVKGLEHSVQLTGQETRSSYLSSTACLAWADLFMSYN